MLSYAARLFLMLTAVTPVGFTYACIALLEKEYLCGLIIISVCIAMVLMTIKFIQYAKVKLSSCTFKPVSIETADSENIAFMLLYLLPLFENGFSDLNWPMTIPAVLLFAAVIWTGYGYHFNPLLGFLGWHFYKVSTEEGVTYILLTKEELRTAKKTMNVGQLTEYIVIDKGRENI